MTKSNEQKELLITDLAKAFGPDDHISSLGALNKWRSVSYECNEFSGVLLASLCKGKPEDITFDPSLIGWYKIFTVIPGFTHLNVYLKLSSDEGFEKIRNQSSGLEEVLWRCADMTGEAIILTKKYSALSDDCSALAGFRFVPMTEEEIKSFKAEQERTDTKNLYVGNDMHNVFYQNDMHDLEDWLQTVLPYRGSDVEWFAPEEIRMIMGGQLPLPVSDFSFFREGDRNIHIQLQRFSYDDILKAVVSKAHQIGIKVAVSLRMGAWGIFFPYNETYFDSPFFLENPQWRCIDRNGEEVSTLSYAYPEVRRYLIDMLVNSARSGCDAISLIGHRGLPFVLFEKPVRDRFFELYGEEPNELPLDEPRLNRLHCDIMTEFVRELREALDRNFGKNRVEIHLRSQYSPIDAKNVGFDVEELIREGLITTVVSYPHRCYELLPDGIWKDEAKTRIDLDKYTAYSREKRLLYYKEEFDELPPYTNTRGELCGPASGAERVAQWQAFEDRYKTKIYYEIFPRVMPNAEFQRRAVELYEAGAKRIALWDTSERAPVLAMWNLVKKLGHREELSGYDPYMNAYKCYRVLKYGEMNMTRYNPMWGG